MGNKYYRQQNFDKAEVEYRKALGKNPRNTQAMYNLGCALLQQQKDSAAIVQLENAGKAETSAKRKAMAYHNIGVICQSHQMYGEAIQAYQESLRNNPDDNETRYNLALCKHLQKKQNDNKNNGGGNDKNDDKKEQNQKDNENNKDNSKQQKQTPKDQMSKENAEQLLNAAVQDEKATQQRMKKAMQEPRRRQLQKNW
jgi:Ca-activated chloride channel family protein